MRTRARNPTPGETALQKAISSLKKGSKLSVNDTAILFKVSKTTLHRQWNQVKAGKTPATRLGRPPIVSEAQKETLLRNASQRDREKNSFTLSTLTDAVVKMKKEEAKLKGHNTHAVKRPSRASMSRLSGQITPDTVKQPSQQNKRRHEVIADVRTFVSEAAVFGAVLGVHEQGDASDRPPPQLIFNSDAVSHFCIKKKKAAKLAAKSRPYLKGKGLSAGITEDKKQSRVVKMTNTTSPGLGLVGCVVTIEDSDFKFKEGKKLRMFNVMKAPLCIDVLLVSSAATTTDVASAVMEYGIIPVVQKAREDFMRQEAENFQSLMSQSQEESQHSEELSQQNATSVASSAESTTVEGPRTVLSFDGDIPQVKVANMEGKMKDKVDKLRASLVKLPASSSLGTQPNDMMTSHMTIHSLASNLTEEMGTAPYTALLEETLEKYGMAAASRKTFVHFLSHLPGILSTAYKLPTVQEGWR